MDGIAKLRGVNTWAYVQRNQFPGQGDGMDKVFVFKMFEVGPDSGVEPSEAHVAWRGSRACLDHV